MQFTATIEDVTRLVVPNRKDYIEVCRKLTLRGWPLSNAHTPIPLVGWWETLGTPEWWVLYTVKPQAKAQRLGVRVALDYVERAAMLRPVDGLSPRIDAGLKLVVAWVAEPTEEATRGVVGSELLRSLPTDDDDVLNATRHLLEGIRAILHYPPESVISDESLMLNWGGRLGESAYYARRALVERGHVDAALDLDKAFFESFTKPTAESPMEYLNAHFASLSARGVQFRADAQGSTVTVYATRDGTALETRIPSMVLDCAARQDPSSCGYIEGVCYALFDALCSLTSSNPKGAPS